ncbi:MAG: hypothetical protein H0X63_04125 [Flavobacteriales bacterium]|nr:hypothetical protein [Flavobacteriales bacterium]
MDYKLIILIFGAVAALIYLIKARKTINILIVFAQITAIGLIFIVSKTVGYYIFSATILLALSSPFFSKARNQFNKNWIWLFLIPVLVAFLFEIFNFPGYGIIRLAMLIPLAFFIYAGINYRQYKDEIGIMILFAADALAKLFGYFL